MTATPAQNVPAAGTIAGRAALIVTCYGQRGQLQPLVDQIQQDFALVETESRGNLIYCDHSPPERLVWMQILMLAGIPAHDTTLVQLILNEPGAAGSAWPTMLRRLRDSGLYAVMDTLAQEQRFWGYTLVYQAVLAEQTSPAAAMQVLCSVVRSDATRNVYTAPLAQTDLPGGRLWLVDIPLDGAGRTAASVYAALVDADHNNDLINMLCGAHAPLLMPDLIAHKAYYHIRQYHRPDWIDRYKQDVQALRTNATTILRQQTQRHAATDTSFGDLKQTYATLLEATTLLDTLRIVLHEQHANYTDWQPVEGLGAIAAYHQQHMTSAIAHLHLLAEAGRSTLDVTRTTVEIIQTDLQTIESRREQTIGTWLAVAGVVLAVPQVITTDVAGSVILPIVLRALGQTPPESYSLQAALLIQIGCILLALLVVWIAVRWRRQRRG